MSMTDLIISIAFFICLGIPLLIVLVQTFRRRIQISKKELIIAIVIAIAFTGIEFVKLNRGSSIKSISPFAIYSVLIAIADGIAYKKQQNSKD